MIVVCIVLLIAFALLLDQQCSFNGFCLYLRLFESALERYQAAIVGLVALYVAYETINAMNDQIDYHKEKDRIKDFKDRSILIDEIHNEVFSYHNSCVTYIINKCYEPSKVNSLPELPQKVKAYSTAIHFDKVCGEELNEIRKLVSENMDDILKLLNLERTYSEQDKAAHSDIFFSRLKTMADLIKQMRKKNV